MTEQDIARVFTEWLRQYLANPEQFSTVVEGTVEEHGTRQAACFVEIARELGIRP